MTIRLIVGLGNPGQQYRDTRHNAGAWFVERVASKYGIELREEKKFSGLCGRGNIAGHDVRLLIPSTFMNLSGRATSAVCKFYSIDMPSMLVAHDELDLAPGIVRLKVGGGHGGHNGLRDIFDAHGNNREFPRVRIGIGHPGRPEQVSGYVLSKAPATEQALIEQAVDAAVNHVEDIFTRGIQHAMNSLNRFKAKA